MMPFGDWFYLVCVSHDSSENLSGLDLFREFFGGGLDGWFRTVVPPGSFDSNRGFGGAEGEDGQGNPL